MKNTFFNRLHSGESDISSKRFWGGLCVLDGLIMSTTLVLTDWVVITEPRLTLIKTIFTVGGGLLGVGILQYFNKPKSK